VAQRDLVLTRDRFCAKRAVVVVEGLSGLTLAIARAEGAVAAAAAAVRGLARQGETALARLWLGEAGGSCCAGDGMHLVASAGRPRDPAEDWSGTGGRFHLVPPGAGKIGKVGASGSATLLHDMSGRSSWIVDPAWAAREGIRSFAAQPLVDDGRVLGVLAVFSRSRIDAAAFSRLRAIADHVAAAIARGLALAALERSRVRLTREVACLREDARRAAGERLVTAGAAGRKLLAQIELAATTDASLLVAGEPGTGKELVARTVHERSRRSGAPFVAVRCSDPEHAQPGVLARRLEAAGDGTLLLDEVGALPPALQDALLAGWPDPRAASVARVIATTTSDLEADAAAGRFRRALYLRLSVLAIAVPPLRDRPGDVPALVTHFLERAAGRRVAPPAASARDLQALARHPWPGNTRELAAAVERAVANASGGRVRFDVAVAPASGDVIPALDWRRRERDNLEAALARSRGRIYGPTGAAELLGMPPTTLASRLKALGIKRPGPAAPQ
jgi:transcriptional regulator with GAF, ATPase, and Fis domain